MQKYFSLNFWFDLSPGPFNLIALKILAVIFFVCLILMAVFIYLYKFKKKDKFITHLYRKLYLFFFACAFIGFIFLFFFYEQAYLLAARFWFLLWILMFVVWLFFIIKFVVKDIPLQRKKIGKKREFEKYLPK